MSLLRVAAVVLLLLLLLNPARQRASRGGAPLVLLDYSLSMGTAGLDSARRIAGPARRILAFGERVVPLDSSPAPMGASRVTPALVQAAARGGGAVVITDGELEDLADAPPDLLRQVGMVLVPRDTVPSIALLEARLPDRVSARDTVRVSATLGAWGEGLPARATVSVETGGASLAAAQVPVPPPGATGRAELAFPAGKLQAGPQALTVRVSAGSGDREPRDDARVRVIDVSPLPAVVVLGAPADWEVRFLGETLRDVVRAPVQAFVMIERGRWRDAATLGTVGASQVQAAAREAALVVWRGSEAASASFRPTAGGFLALPVIEEALAGDWYVEPPPASPIAGGLGGVRWDSLAPVTWVIPLVPGPGDWTALEARLARRGVARPVLVGRARGGLREVTVAASGLWQWQFRGGSEAEAYRAVVAAAADWLLAGRAATRDRVVPLVGAVPFATPVTFQRRDTSLAAVGVTLVSGDSTRHDSLVFDPSGRAVLRLPPGAYRYTLSGAAGRGVVAVEQYSDEFHPRPVLVAARPAPPLDRLVLLTARGSPWLFVAVLALFVAEWVWRRRRGLP